MSPYLALTPPEGRRKTVKVSRLWMPLVLWLLSLQAAASPANSPHEMPPGAMDEGEPSLAFADLYQTLPGASDSDALPALSPWALTSQPRAEQDEGQSLATEATQTCLSGQDAWTLQVMPLGLLYRSYLAGAKEPRFASYWNSDSVQGQLWDAAAGGRLGVLRYGTCDPVHPEGWQVDLEGGCQTRLDPIANSNTLFSVDFRAGVPVTWAQGRWQFKTGYYHISSHLGDEYLLMNPTARRVNYVRDAIMLGLGFFCTERLRLYGETAYALGVSDGAEPLEFQFGADWAPARDTGVLGAPFAAVNAHLREEVDFGGNLVLQAGWAWRQFDRGSLFRIGVQYYRGKSDQYEYYDRSEERIGWGIWADF